MQSLVATRHRSAVATTYRPVPLEFERLEPAEALSRSESFLAVMRRRRSVRHFAPEPVERTLIDNALAAAATAPSGATGSRGDSSSSPTPP
jgi:hypothetical protein